MQLEITNKNLENAKEILEYVKKNSHNEDIIACKIAKMINTIIFKINKKVYQRTLTDRLLL